MAQLDKTPDDLARVRHLLARERSVDRGAWLRLSGWGVSAIAAVTLAAYAYEVYGGFRRDNATAADVARDLRQTQQALQTQIQTNARDASIESKRLAAAVGTLNSDRDRLYTRVSSLEQSLDSVTGSLSRQAAALASAANVTLGAQAVLPTAAAAKPAAAPAVAPPDTTATASAAPAETAAGKTVFGVDLGASPSLDGLRAIWRRDAAASTEIAALQPIVVVRDASAPGGVALHVVAGPLGDAAAAARVCAKLAPRDKGCEPAVYEGQRLALDTPAASPAAPAATPPRKKPRPARPVVPLPVPQPR